MGNAHGNIEINLRKELDWSATWHPTGYIKRKVVYARIRPLGPAVDGKRQVSRHSSPAKKTRGWAAAP